MTGGPEPLKRCFADHLLERGDALLRDRLHIDIFVPRRGVADQFADPEVEIEIFARTEGEFRQNGNPGLEMEQGRRHMNPGRMAEENTLHAFVASGMLVDQHGDVLAFVDCAQHRADSFGLVDKFMHFSGPVGQDHLADERVAERTHH